MKAYFRILLWTIAFQGILMLCLSPPADCVPIHPVAFAFAPSFGVFVATIGELRLLHVVYFFGLTYVAAFLVRIAGQFTPWWNYDPGFFAAIFLVPAFIAGLIWSVQLREAERPAATHASEEELRKLLDEHRKNNA